MQIVNHRLLSLRMQWITWYQTWNKQNLISFRDVLTLNQGVQARNKTNVGTLQWALWLRRGQSQDVTSEKCVSRIPSFLIQIAFRWPWPFTNCELVSLILASKLGIGWCSNYLWYMASIGLQNVGLIWILPCLHNRIIWLSAGSDLHWQAVMIEAFSSCVTSILL